MYFASRAQAGRLLADQLRDKYRYENCAVLALNDGGVVVGAEIAATLHCQLTMLLLSEVTLPRELRAVGSVNMEGTFTYDPTYSEEEISDINGEFRNYIEGEKLTQLHAMHQLAGASDLARHDMLKNRNVIVVADGLRGGALLKAAENFLKPISLERLIVATPMADVPALDTIHVMADEIHCLSVVDDTFEIGHYFDAQDVPSHETVVQLMKDIVLRWQ